MAHHRSRWLLLALLALAALLRLGWPGLTEFKADEARLFTLALDLAEFKAFPLRGIGSSVGIPNFPLSVWLFALPLFVWRHPYAATLFVGALNTAAVYVCYRLVRRYWSETAALVASLFFAASPWAVIYSRKIWAQDLLPLFVLAYIGSALAAFVEGRRWFLLMHFVALALIVQIHLSGLAFIPLTLLLLLIFWRRTRAALQESALGVIAAVLTAAPFGLWLLTHANEGGLALATDLFSRPAVISLDSLRFAWLLLGGFDIHSLAGPAAFRDYLNSVPNIDLLRWLWGLLALGGLGVALRRRQPADLILCLWLIVPILFFIRHSTPVFPHYFIITLPAGCILAGIVVQWLSDCFTAKTQRAQRENWKLGFGISGFWKLLIVISAAAQAGAWLALLFFVARVDTPGGFGAPLGALLDVADTAQNAYAVGGAPEVLIVGEGDDPAIHEFPAVMEALLRNTPHRFVNGNEAALASAQGAVVVVQSPTLKAFDWYQRCVVWGSCIQLGAGQRGMTVLRLPADTPMKIDHPFPEPRTLANGVELLGWAAETEWTVFWRVGYVPAAADYHFFNHSTNAQADGVGYPARYWRDGDRVISFFDLRPTGPVRVGMYEYPAVTNVPVLDAAGNPYADAVTAEP